MRLEMYKDSFICHYPESYTLCKPDANYVYSDMKLEANRKKYFQHPSKVYYNIHLKELN